MRRRVLLCLTLISLSACNGDKIASVQPNLSPAAPTKDISDAAHGGTNPDFFFLPPMVKNPTGSEHWSAGSFNPNLAPVVKVSCLDAGGAVTPCVDATTLSAVGSAADEHYHANWKVPASATIYYRLSVKVGSKELGFADVQTGANGSQLKNVATGEFVPLVDGRTLPIKFRIEKYALCETPGDPTKPCVSRTINLNQGGQISAPLTPGSEELSGVIFALQPQPLPAGEAEPTVTLASCAPFNPRVTDLPVFGPCVRVEIDPALTAPLPVPATVYSCEVYEQAVQGGVSSAEQAERLAMHELNEQSGSVLRSLPHAHPTCGTPTPAISSSNFRDVFRALANGEFGSAARYAAGMLAPKPLLAARFIDLGGGGRTHIILGGGDDDGGLTSRSSTSSARLSVSASLPPLTTIRDYQFALPARFDVSATPTNLTSFPGSTIDVTVRVIDLAGEPVRGARVNFGSSTGSSVDPVADNTLNDGVAKVSWTLSTTPGVNTLTASGRGIAGTDFNGPREGIDPFQPLSNHWDGPSVTEAAVTVRTGSLTVTATGRFPEIAIYKNYDGWSGKDESVLQSPPFNYVRGTNYSVRSMSQLSAISATTTLAIITSASNDDQLNQISQQRAAAANLEAWVRSGGLLIMHAGDNASVGYIIPGLTGAVDGTLNCAGLTLASSDHAFIRGPDELLGTSDDLTDASIDIAPRGGCYDNHGSLANILPANAEVLMREEVGSQHPVYATYALGAGRVIVTTLTLEFGPHATQTLINHFYWAIKRSNPNASVLASKSSLMAPQLPSRSVTGLDDGLYSDGTPKP